MMIMTYLNEPLMARLFALNPITFIKRPWQLVTYMFMHGNFAHLFFNMYTLYVFGTVLERVWGTRKFLLYYFVTGIGAALVHIGVQWLTGDFALTVGASGAIYGILMGYLSVNCPLNAETEGIFNADAFSKMKVGLYFINTARGGVLDEQALADALNSGMLSGAAIDVLTKEPMREGCPLLTAKNITITPHVAWAPLQTRERLLSIVVSNIEAFIGGSPTNVVN